MHRLSLFIGIALLAGVWLGPLPAAAEHAFSAHMTMHMAIVAVAAAFLALGLANGRFDAARRWPSLFSPIAASVGELVVVWSWHAPGLHTFARESGVGFVLEQGSFLLVGFWLWLSAFGGSLDGTVSSAGVLGSSAGSAQRHAPRTMAAVIQASDAISAGRRAAGVAGLLFTSMHMTLLGALLALTPRALYPHMTGGAAMTALEDQHLGGAIMLLVGGISYLTGGLYLTASLVRSGRRRVKRGSRAAVASPHAGGAADVGRSGRRRAGEASDKASSLTKGKAKMIEDGRPPVPGAVVRSEGSS